MKIRVIVLLGCFSLPVVALGRVIIVGDPTPDYIQITNAVRFAGAGAVIRVSTGTYVEVFDILSKNNLTIEGDYDTGCVSKVAGETRLSMPPPGGNPVVLISNSIVHLIDLDIVGGAPLGSFASHGGGVSIEAKSVVRMTGCRVYNNRANGYGGGIYVTNSSLTVTNCLIFSNRAVGATSGIYQPEGCGGGIGADNSYVEIYGDAAGGAENSIKWNYADRAGGGLYVANKSWCIISNETSDVVANTATNGGGIAVENGSRLDVLAGPDVCGNVASNDGGGIYLLTSSTCHLRNASTFVGFNGVVLGPNVAGTNGGGIFASDSRVEIVASSSVAHNKADWSGGGVYLTNSVCLVDGGNIGYRHNFTHTNEANFGGGVLAYIGSRLILTNNAVIHGNRAVSSGGGVHALLSEVVLYDSIVRHNTATHNGGGINISGGAITGTTSLVYGNSADKGGGLYGSQVFDGGMFVSTTFSNNQAATEGGGIYWWWGGAPLGGTLTMSNGCRVVENTAGTDGGGLWVLRADANLSSGYFSGNVANRHGGALYGVTNAAVLLNNVSLEYNTADADLDGDGNGGAIWVGDGASVEIGSPSAGLVRLGDNSAAQGGAICAEGGATVQIYEAAANIRLDRNTAAEEGGAIAALRSTIVITGGVTFTENTSPEDGGGIYADECTLRISGGVVFGDNDTNLANRAGDLGGGMAVNQSQVFLHDVTFLNNTASNFSGGLDAISSLLAGTNVVFLGNRALRDDGGAMFGESCTGILLRATFTSNSAPLDGGAVAWVAGRLQMTGSRATGNAAGHGGGFQLSAVNAFFHGVTMAVNRAIGDGGGIRLMVAGRLYGTNLVFTGNVADSDLNGSGSGGALQITAGARADLYGTGGTTLVQSNHACSGGGISVSTGRLYVAGNSWWEGNVATNGGAMFLAAGTAEVFNAYILRNAAVVDAGGAWIFTNASAVFVNSLLAENLIGSGRMGGGIYNRSGQLALTLCTLVSNAESGVDCTPGSVMNVNGCIVYGHSRQNLSPGFSVQYSDVEGGYPGTGNFSEPPLLLNDNYHLSAWSPCRNKGWAAASELDVDGEWRTGNVDVGFDEYADADTDNLPDVVETKTGVWVSDADMGTDPADDDSDDDGVLDGDEWMADTDPNQAASVLRITQIAVTGNSCTVQWSGGTNAVQYWELCRDFATATGSPTWLLRSTYLPPTPSPGIGSKLLETNEVFRIRATRFATP